MSFPAEVPKVVDVKPDIILVTDGGQKISCHKYVLSSESHYFQAMFGANFAEKDQTSVHIKKVDSFGLRMLVDMAYGHPLEIDYEIAKILLELATVLQFPKIQEKCSTILQNNMHISNVLEIFTLSETLAINELKKHSLAYILYNFETLILNPDQFSTLHEDHLLLILSHSNLRCKSEMEVVQVIVDRLAECTEENVIIEGQLLHRFLRAVRFSMLNLNDLFTIYAMPVFHESLLLRDVIQFIILKKKGKCNARECCCHCHGHPVKDQEELCSKCKQECFLPIKTEEKGANRSVCCVSPTDCFKSIETEDSSPVTEVFVVQNEESDNICFHPDAIQLAEELLSLPPRTSPYVPCVVSHIQNTESFKGTINFSQKLFRNSEGPVLMAFHLDSSTFQTNIQLSKVHQGPVEATGYKVCSTGRLMLHTIQERCFYLWRRVHAWIQ